MDFFELLENTNLDYEMISNKSKQIINNITLSSKEASEKNIFVAIKGFKTDGHIFIEDAYRRGCRNFIIENKFFLIPENIIDTSNIVFVKDSREAIGKLSRAINNYVDEKLYMIGITGTKGKSSVSTLIHYLLNNCEPASLFTTVKIICGDKIEDAERTTMEAYQLQKYLNFSYQYGQKKAVVEVSSHAVTLKRVEDIQWNCGVWTTFSQDHLDLYGTMENYFQAKLDFFRALDRSKKQNKIAIINLDDPKGYDVCKVFKKPINIVTISSKDRSATFFIENSSIIEYNSQKITQIEFKYKNTNFSYKTQLLGDFNIINTMLAIATAISIYENKNSDNYKIKPTIENFCKIIRNFQGVSGRFEIVIDKPFTAIVDYAHTPDSLEKIIGEGKKLAKNRVITIFGCTGDRDKEKREIMGKISCEKSDFTIITDDDLYTEKSEDIINMIKKGFFKENYTIIPNRKEAIKYAMEIAKEGDVLLFCGMGHQNYQITNQGKIDHSDKEEILKYYKQKMEL